jgi:large subunit ribosomal protein L24
MKKDNLTTKRSLKKGDNIIVISGDSKGKTGVIEKIITADNKAIVKGLNIVTKHIKPTTSKPNGSIVKEEAPIHLSNMMIVDSKGKPSRVGKKLDKDGKYIRIAKTTGEEIKNG